MPLFDKYYLDTYNELNVFLLILLSVSKFYITPYGTHTAGPTSTRGMLRHLNIYQLTSVAIIVLFDINACLLL